MHKKLDTIQRNVEERGSKDVSTRHSETEIDNLFGAHVSTIIRPIKVLRWMRLDETLSLYKYGDWNQGTRLIVKEKIAGPIAIEGM